MISVSPPSPVRSRVRAHMVAEDWLGLAVVLALFLLVLAPLGSVLVQAFVPGLFSRQASQPGFSGLAEVFSRPLWQRSLTNSLFLATIAACLGGAMGTGLALLRQSPHLRLGGALDLAAWAVIILPSFLLAQGWTLFASRGGLAVTWFGLDWMPDLVFNRWGLAVIMALKACPFAYLTVTAALSWRVEDQFDAARLCGASRWRLLWTVRLPLLLPAILSGMVLVFIDTLGDFGLPAALATTYRFPTLTYAIYVAINQSPIRFDLAGVLAFYVTALMLCAVLSYLWLLRRRGFGVLEARAERGAAPPAPARIGPNMVAGLALMLLLVIPIGSSALVSVTLQMSGGLEMSNLTLQHYRALFAERAAFTEALGTSLRIAAIAACGSGLLAAAAAYVTVFSDFRLKRLIDVTCTFSLAVPGVVLGIGYIFVWNAPPVARAGLSLYGTEAILVLAAIAGAVPVAVRVLLGAMAQVPASMLQAAALQGAGLWRRLATILFPLVSAALISATLTAFGAAMFDLAISSILRPPRLEVLPVYVNRSFELGLFGQATAATLVAGGLTVFLISVIRALTTHGLAWALAVKPAPVTPPIPPGQEPIR